MAINNNTVAPIGDGNRTRFHGAPVVNLRGI